MLPGSCTKGLDELWCRWHLENGSYSMQLHAAIGQPSVNSWWNAGCEAIDCEENTGSAASYSGPEHGTRDDAS
jgi:hypothetical protein